MNGRDERIAVVLAGGGARGAYEAGALSVLLPELEQRGQRPRLVIGTSVGALLARLLAGDADAQHAELLSFLLFAPEFTKALIRTGQSDARHWISQQHDLDDLWQLGDVPAT